MTGQERARALLGVVSLISSAQTQLDALAVGDPSGIPNELKHSLDAPRERIRAYARSLYLGAGQDRNGTPASSTDATERDGNA